MTTNGVISHACKSLSMSDREIARELDLSIGALRSLSRERCPRYLQLALAALITHVDADKILNGGRPANDVDQPVTTRIRSSHAYGAGRS